MVAKVLRLLDHFGIQVHGGIERDMVDCFAVQIHGAVEKDIAPLKPLDKYLEDARLLGQDMEVAMLRYRSEAASRESILKTLRAERKKHVSEFVLVEKCGKAFQDSNLLTPRTANVNSATFEKGGSERAVVQSSVRDFISGKKDVDKVKPTTPEQTWVKAQPSLRRSATAPIFHTQAEQGGDMAARKRRYTLVSEGNGDKVAKERLGYSLDSAPLEHLVSPIGSFAPRSSFTADILTLEEQVCVHAIWPFVVQIS